MNLKELFEDDGAVSPVIGVILMVAITVILAAVIGTFVLGLGDRVSQAQPSATFTFDYNKTATPNNALSVTHDGGDGVETSQLKLTVSGSKVWEGEGGLQSSYSYLGGNKWDSDKITAGSKLSVADTGAGTIKDGNSVKVIWTASGSDKTAVIGESEVSL
ncbi:type IV pilin [Halorussus aquaticus]|uniref:Type IV pilin n=1 Tax=Halorussus aquaticus TaxID=2953748 RepID=A0ABD5PXD4_9EURY|nr:type IV pilin N-terminal domain-containing protein [Halorussus aquaticus]